MIGRVVSTKMQKTAVVLVERQKTHPLYKKSFLRSKKYLVDDPIGVNLGDIVEFEKIRPISRRKHWQIKRVVGKDIVALGTQELKEKAAEVIAEVIPEERQEESRSEEVKNQNVKVKSTNKKSAKEKKEER